MEKALPAIPSKRYFTIGEVGDLCGVKPHVLRYWEQEFTQLRPMKRRGNRRYYQHHEVLMIRRIRDLLYDQGFTISGARNKMQEILQSERDRRRNGEMMLEGVDELESNESEFVDSEFPSSDIDPADSTASSDLDPRVHAVSHHAGASNPIKSRAAAIGEVEFADSLAFNTDGFNGPWLQLRQELHEIRDLLAAPA